MSDLRAAGRRGGAPTFLGILAELAFVAALGGACCVACILVFLAAR